MTTKVKDLTNERLDVLVAEKVMELHVGQHMFMGERFPCNKLLDAEGDFVFNVGWRPSTDISCAFQVDKPEWEWLFDESPHICMLRVGVLDHTLGVLKRVFVPLDPANKASAYCRGRCIVALKACGITEVD